MKFLSVSTKLNIAIISISLASLTAAFFILSSYQENITNDLYKETKKELIYSADEKIKSKMRVGITNAISISNDERIKKAFVNNDRQFAIDSLKDISSKMKRHTDFKNIKIHLHTKDNISFLRNWKLDKYGDDLSSFRTAVVTVNNSLEPITTFEPGRAGLLLRGITPIISHNHEHFGSLEFIQGINSVVKEFDKKDIGFMLLMDGEVNKNMKTGKDFSFKDDRKFKNYIISQKYMNKDFLKDANKIDMQKLFEDGHLITSKYFYTYTNVKNFKNNHLGIILLGEPASIINNTVEKAETLIYLALLGILIMTIIINVVMISAIKKLVTNPLKLFENGLLDFFQFLQGKKDYSQHIDLNTSDEFGHMAKKLQENISVSAKLHEDIQELNTNLEEKVEIKTKEIGILLDNAGQGFLSFSCNLIIDERYSKECIKLLGDDLSGKYLADVLFKDSQKKIFFQETVLDACQIDNDVIQRSILSLLPSEIILNKRALQLTYKILENNHIMLIITNVTAQKKLEKKIKKEQETLQKIVGVISESDSFYDTKRDYEEFISTYKELIDNSKTSLHNISEIYRNIHTFKGAFSQLYMGEIVAFLHSLESEISDMIKNNTHTNEKILALLDSSNFRTSLQKELSNIKDVLGEEFINSENFVKINFHDIKRLQNNLYSLFKQQNLESSESKEVLNQISGLSNQRIINLLKPYPNLIQKLATTLEKDVYEFGIIGDSEIVVDDKFKPLFKSLIHIFRNCIDHGIETPEERVANNKDETGTISCSFNKKENEIQIIISDDGSGIDKEKVLAKAIEEKIVTQGDAKTLSDNDIFNFIFNEHFSTMDEVSELSGRGVGMNAVKVEMDRVGGNIEIHSQKDTGTTFVLNLPHNERDM